MLLWEATGSGVADRRPDTTPRGPGHPVPPPCKLETPTQGTQSPGPAGAWGPRGKHIGRARSFVWCQGPESKHTAASACIVVCSMFLYLHLYIYNFIKKRKRVTWVLSLSKTRVPGGAKVLRLWERGWQPVCSVWALLDQCQAGSRAGVCGPPVSVSPRQ